MSSELPLGFPHLLCAPQHCLYFSSDHTSAVCTLSFFQHFDTGSSISRYMRWKISFGVSHKGFFLKRLFLTFFFFLFWQEKLRCEKIKKANFSFTILNRTNLGILGIWSCYRIDFSPPPLSFLISLRNACLHLSSVMETEYLLFT